MTENEYLTRPYTYLLVRDALGGYAAEILEFPGCCAHGATADDAMHALRQAAAAWIRAALAHRHPIPASFRAQGSGGKIALRLPKSLHRHATHCAQREGVSLNQFLVAAIATRVGAEAYATRLTAQLLEILRKHVPTASTRGTHITLEEDV